MQAKQPIYVLDEDLTIVFFNRACQEWLGTAAEGLLGRTCAYHSSPAVGGPEAVAAALCPPPASLSGEISTATVARVAEDGTSVERRARFLPIGAVGEDVLGILAILDATDRAPDSTADAAFRAPPKPDPIALHEAIRRFRQEAAARFRADRLIGQGPAMRLARRQVELAAASRSSVLLVGPPGSGRRIWPPPSITAKKGSGVFFRRSPSRPRRNVPDAFSSDAAGLLVAGRRFARSGRHGDRTRDDARASKLVAHAVVPSDRRTSGRGADATGRLLARQPSRGV